MSTVHYDAQINTKIDYSINHAFKNLKIQKLNALHHICELEWTHLLSILAIYVQNLQQADYLLTGNRSNFLYVEGSTALFYDCFQFLSPLSEIGNCFYHEPICYQDIIRYTNPITRQTFTDISPKSFDNIPHNATAICLENDK